MCHLFSVVDGKNAVAAWAGRLGKRNGKFKSCVEIGGVFFNVGQAETGGGLSLKSCDVTCFPGYVA